MVAGGYSCCCYESLKAVDQREGDLNSFISGKNIKPLD